MIYWAGEGSCILGDILVGEASVAWFVFDEGSCILGSVCWVGGGSFSLGDILGG